MEDEQDDEGYYYMCATDYDHHIDNDPKGAEVYGDIEDLRRERPCVKQCGITRFRITNVVTVQKPDYRGEE